MRIQRKPNSFIPVKHVHHVSLYSEPQTTRWTNNVVNLLENTVQEQLVLLQLEEALCSLVGIWWHWYCQVSGSSSECLLCRRGLVHDLQVLNTSLPGSCRGLLQDIIPKTCCMGEVGLDDLWSVRRSETLTQYVKVLKVDWLHECPNATTVVCLGWQESSSENL